MATTRGLPVSVLTRATLGILVFLGACASDPPLPARAPVAAIAAESDVAAIAPGAGGGVALAADDARPDGTEVDGLLRGLKSADARLETGALEPPPPSRAPPRPRRPREGPRSAIC